MHNDFFTRLINTQAHGPNIQKNSTNDGCLIFYACPSCDEEHEDKDDASECCPRHISTIYRCPVCRTEHPDEDDAAKCHPAGAKGQPMQCPVCLEEAASFADAADCCLHVHPTITAAGRARIAAAVEDGIPWAEAVQANSHH